MNEKFDSFWARLSKAARKRHVPLPTGSETNRLADDVLRGLRSVVPNPEIWWTPLARRVALVALVLALVSITLIRQKPTPIWMGPDRLSAAFLAHELPTNL